MDKDGKQGMERRRFLGSVTGLMAGSCLCPLTLLGDAPTQSHGEDLSDDEKNLVAKSTMAKLLENYFGKGYSCAESMLMLGLNYLKKPKDLVWTASPFGGGMNHRDLCGFLTAGFITIGLAAGDLKKEKRVARRFSKELSRKYWEWWKTTAPLHCAEIRTPGTTGKTCLRLGYLAALKLEELLQT